MATPPLDTDTRGIRGVSATCPIAQVSWRRPTRRVILDVIRTTTPESWALRVDEAIYGNHQGPGLQSVHGSHAAQTGSDTSDSPIVVREAGARIAANISRVIEGKPEAVLLGVAVLLAEGHLLIEDVPGVGKTKFAKAMARSIDCSVRACSSRPTYCPVTSPG